MACVLICPELNLQWLSSTHGIYFTKSYLVYEHGQIIHFQPVFGVKSCVDPAISPSLKQNMWFASTHQHGIVAVARRHTCSLDTWRYAKWQ